MVHWWEEKKIKGKEGERSGEGGMGGENNRAKWINPRMTRGEKENGPKMGAGRYN